MNWVQKDTDEEDLKDNLLERNITVRNIAKVSNEESKFDSFKVETTTSHMYKILAPSFWPSGIHVKRFFKPRSLNSDNHGSISNNLCCAYMPFLFSTTACSGQTYICDIQQ